MTVICVLCTSWNKRFEIPYIFFEINFEIPSKSIIFADAPAALWEAVDHISDRDYFFTQIQFIYNVKLVERHSVIIFDEIQKCPAVRQAIKYLVKDHRYDYIETGSLISIKKNIEGIVIPSEETSMTMYPMDYEEFRWALNDTATVSLLRDAFSRKAPLGDAIIRKLHRDFRLYMLVGGMPQAVSTYLDGHNLSDVDMVKRSILEIYDNDFRRIDPSGKAARMFRAIPAELNKNASRYQPTSVLGRSENQAAMAELLQALDDSLTVNFAYHADDPSVGMSMYADYDKYKMFVGDTGLFVSLDRFCEKFSSRVGDRYLVYTKDLRKDKATLLVPVCMAMCL